MHTISMAIHGTLQQIKMNTTSRPMFEDFVMDSKKMVKGVIDRDKGAKYHVICTAKM